MQTPCKRKTRYSENPPVEGHVGWVIDSKDHVTTASSTTALEPTAPITVSSQATGMRYVSELTCISLCELTCEDETGSSNLQRGVL